MIGLAIVTHIIREQEIHPFLEAGFTLEWLNDKKGHSSAVFYQDKDGSGPDRVAYGWILDQWSKHGQIPSEELFRSTFRAYFAGGEEFFSDAQLPVQQIIEHAVAEVQREVIMSSLKQVDRLAQKEGDVPAAVRAYLAGARMLTEGLRSDGGTFTILGDTAFDLEAFMHPEFTEGIPMGIPSIDEDFGGWQPGQLITLLGRQKAMKTSIALYSAYHAWEQNYRVLFYSVELDETVLRQRIYGIGAKVNPDRFRRGILTEAEVVRVRELQADMEDFSEDGIDFAISKKTAMLTVDDVAREIIEFKPAVVYIDGFYFMRDRLSGKSAGSNWEANENVAAELKELAMTHKVPIITSTQVQEKQHNNKSKGIDGATIMGGTGLLKASDLVLGLDKEQGEDDVLINCVYSRFKPVSDVTINWHWDKMEIEETAPRERVDVSDRA